MLDALKEQQRGRLITVFGVMVLSFDTLLVRLIDSNEWTLIFWRGFLPAAMLFIVQWFSDKKLITQHLLRPSLLTLITAGLFSASTICFVLSLNNTQVASTLVITNTAPLFTAVIGFFFLKEKLDKATIFAIIIAVGGIGLVFGYHPTVDELRGDSLALVSAVAIAVYLVALRKTQGQLGSIYIILAGVFTSIISLSVGAKPFALDMQHAIYMFLLGGVVIPLSFYLIAHGPRYLPAAETSLILLLEVLFGPLLVWLIIGETPTDNVLLGSAVVVLTLSCLFAWQWRKQLKTQSH
ncbi:EamA/RhaT family transporter [Photobacterium sp. GB-27]|nr:MULTISPECIES: DMT family transporter [unclassified Photobacterium]PSV28975.1 EamA/RhaT family transporter [Photobacterium sp. GB-56]PSV33170.1 EamA/RhaT family transporter [Photobacterium sp. GB-72]PSV39566.1 EamA/RhaT family transporter [Photobacterium sp. GB-27]PSV40869.1 EamA/RhaT family transporter [Photobacterium sp. GB-210]PSV58960.1 EamA/RhaT family transporter [Photobacterium sp. GB-3]